MALGSFRRRSILVSCASFRARKRRCDCCVSVGRLVGTVSTSLRMSSVCLRASSSLRSAATFSSAALRSYSARNSEVLRCISLSSAVIFLSHSVRKASICRTISDFSSARRFRSPSNSAAFFSNFVFICVCSSASLRSKSVRKAAVRCFISSSSACILRLLSMRKRSISRIMVTFSSAKRLRSARNSCVRFFKASFSSCLRLHSRAKDLDCCSN
mmetsp:Transcript_16485/g.47259  ORF Transcript_16485/g.47259 Transcript_16485/m.47259 type:complete len:214 (+) Transcript_16485:934-1575(+)